jgi:hypothetical protein
MELVRRFDAEIFARGLADWQWLLGDRKLEPVAASMFGDVFLQGEDGIWFLDSLEGTLTLHWPDGTALQAALNTEEGQDRFLLAGIAISAQEKGICPGPAQVLMFSTPPALGGEISSDNVEAMDYVVASSLCGQMAAQLKDLPPGSKITGISLSD